MGYLECPCRFLCSWRLKGANGNANLYRYGTPPNRKERLSKIVEGGSVTPAETADGEFLRTQYALLQSRALAERVVSVLKLGEDADLLQKKGFSFMSFMNRLIKVEGSNGEQDSAKNGRDRVRRHWYYLGQSRNSTGCRITLG